MQRVPWCLQSQMASLMVLAETVFLGRMIRQQHTPRMFLITSYSMDIAYYLLQDWNHWCSSSFTYRLVGPQALLGCDYTTGRLLHPLGLCVPLPPPKAFHKADIEKISEWLNPSKITVDPSLHPAEERIRSKAPTICAAHRGSEKQGRAEALGK